MSFTVFDIARLPWLTAVSDNLGCKKWNVFGFWVFLQRQVGAFSPSQLSGPHCIEKKGSWFVNWIGGFRSVFELFWKNNSYVSGLIVCIFVALYVGMFVARANKAEGTMSWCLGTNQILASIKRSIAKGQTRALWDRHLDSSFVFYNGYGCLEALH